MTTRLTIVVLFIIFPLLIAGCTSSITDSNPGKLDAFVAEYRAEFSKLLSASEWQEERINDSATRLNYQWEDNFGTFQTNGTIQRFATTTEATDYVKRACDGWDQTSAYGHAYLESHIYNRSIGHDPSVFLYCNNSVNETDNPHRYYVYQLDDLVLYSVVTPVSVDFSRYFDKSYGLPANIVEKNFTKSVDYRGNDVYTGVIRRTDRSADKKNTVVIEVTKTKTDAKNLFNSHVVKAQQDGYTYRSDWVAQLKQEGRQNADEMWLGYSYSLNQEVDIFYQYDAVAQAWTTVTETT